MPLHPAAAARQERHTGAATQDPGTCQADVWRIMCRRTPAGRQDQSGPPSAAAAAAGAAISTSAIRGSHSKGCDALSHVGQALKSGEMFGSCMTMYIETRSRGAWMH